MYVDIPRSPHRQLREIYQAAVEAGAKEPFTVRSIAELAVSKGQPLDEVLSQIAKSCPHLFYASKAKPKRKK